MSNDRPQYDRRKKECYRFLKFNLHSKNKRTFFILSIFSKSKAAQLNIK